MGKIYNILSRQIAESVVAEIEDVVRAECFMVSQIGAPVTRPAIVAISLAMPDPGRLPDLRNQVEAIANDRIAHIPKLIEDFVSGKIELF